MSTEKHFICSFCEKRVKFREDQLRQRGKCPQCNRIVTLLDNTSTNVEHQLRSSWYYRRLRLMLVPQDIGPIDDTSFLRLIQERQINESTEVMSPELTRGEWAELSRVNVAVVQQTVEQRIAERQRLQRNLDRRKQIDSDNRAKLQRAIRSAVESGNIPLGHRQAFEKFAVSAGIPG